MRGKRKKKMIWPFFLPLGVNLLSLARPQHRDSGHSPGGLKLLQLAAALPNQKLDLKHLGPADGAVLLEPLSNQLMHVGILLGNPEQTPVETQHLFLDAAVAHGQIRTCSADQKE